VEVPGVIDGLGNTNQNDRLALAPRPVKDSGRVAQADAPHSPIPASPPDEVLELLDTAATVLQELAASQVRMHIDVVDGGAGKRIHIQVVDADGTLLREIPPHQMFDVLAGTSRGLAFDEQG
jgi:hypothetical protein